MNKPDLETCTLQEACDYALFKIVEQGTQCMSSKGGCAYGDEEGNHCVVGWLLDTDNAELMDCGDDVGELVKAYWDDVPSLVIKHSHFMMEFQDFHDDATSLGRAHVLRNLSKHIETDAPQYKQWVEMGEQE